MRAIFRPFKLFAIVLAMLLLFVGLFITLLAGQQSQDFRSKAFVAIPSDPTPPSTPQVCNSLCFRDADCTSGYCYQPPMPPCPIGAACIQVMPARVCRNASNPDSLTCDVGTTNPVQWNSGHVSLSADDFYIRANGLTFVGNNQIEVHSDPGNSQYTTLELTWFEHAVEMRLYMYFSHVPGEFWHLTEIRTYNGRTPGDWVYYQDTSSLIQNVAGSPFIDSDLTLQDGAGNSLHFSNLHLLPFLAQPSPSPYPTTTACTYHPPHVTVSPATNTGSPGQTLTYSIGVQNTNTGPCASETFQVESFPPDYPPAVGMTSNWITVDDKSSLTVANNATLYFNTSVTPNDSVSSDTYPFDIMVYGTAPNQTVKTTATYIVSTLPTATPTPAEILRCNVSCSADRDCESGYCYQPPMPPCPTGAMCAQVMPPRVCRNSQNPEDSTCMLPPVPVWWSMIPANLRSFLEQLYIFVFFFMRPSNMVHLLNGVFSAP